MKIYLVFTCDRRIDGVCDWVRLIEMPFVPRNGDHIQITSEIGFEAYGVPDWEEDHGWASVSVQFRIPCAPVRQALIDAGFVPVLSERDPARAVTAGAGVMTPKSDTQEPEPTRPNLEFYIFKGRIALRLDCAERPAMVFKFRDSAEARLIAAALIRKAEQLDAGAEVA